MPDKNNKKISFTAAAKILRKLNVTFSQTEEWRPENPPRKPHPLPFFKTINLPFTPKEWCELMMRDGKYNIKQCCDTCEEAWDILQAIFYDSGVWMNMEDLAKVAMLLANHEEFAESLDFNKPIIFGAAIKNWPKLNLWYKLAFLWHLTKDSYVPHVPHGPHPEVPPVENVAYNLEKGLFALSLDWLFAKKDAPNLQQQVQRLMGLYRILPPLRALYDRIGELCPGPLNGYALVDKERNNQVAANGHGLCVYQTRAEAEALISTWRADDDAHEIKEKDKKPIDERIGIRPVRISMEKGIEFLDVEKSQ